MGLKDLGKNKTIEICTAGNFRFILFSIWKWWFNCSTNVTPDTSVLTKNCVCFWMSIDSVLRSLSFIRQETMASESTEGQDWRHITTHTYLQEITTYLSHSFILSLSLLVSSCLCHISFYEWALRTSGGLHAHTSFKLDSLERERDRERGERKKKGKVMEWDREKEGEGEGEGERGRDGRSCCSEVGGYTCHCHWTGVTLTQRPPRPPP